MGNCKIVTATPAAAAGNRGANGNDRREEYVSQVSHERSYSMSAAVTLAGNALGSHALPLKSRRCTAVSTMRSLLLTRDEYSPTRVGQRRARFLPISIEPGAEQDSDIGHGRAIPTDGVDLP